MTTPSPADTDRSRWAPWWLYLVVLLPANYLRAAVVPADALPTGAVVAVAVGQAALLFGLVTVVWRATRKGSR